jgi:integrase/recombinase XerC
MASVQRGIDAREMELIDAYIEHLRRAQRSEQTMADRRAILTRLSRDLPYGIGQVSHEELATWLYRHHLSQNSQATYYRAIKSFYRWAADPADPWIDTDPTLRLEPVRTADGIAHPCTDEQLREILGNAAEPFRTWAVLAAYQGLRAVEISRLDREHVTEQRLIVVKGKGGRPRVHDTDAYVWDALKDLPPGPVARRPDGERADPHYVAVYTRDHFRRKLKIPTTLHSLRHWLGVTVQREYKDVRVTMDVLGHKQMSSTQIYTRATDEQQRAARATLPRLAG